jgi:ABC-type Fe3+-hydroxamate transport system substrate-binding protein
VPAESEPVFVPIWRDPLMTFNHNTFASDLLRLAGFCNVFGDRERQYPLKADLAERSPLSADQVAQRDRRYPRIREQEIVERKPEWILLPSEPYEFDESDRERFLALDTPASKKGRVVLVDGKDLFWPGPRLVGAIARFRALLEETP